MDNFHLFFFLFVRIVCLYPHVHSVTSHVFRTAPRIYGAQIAACISELKSAERANSGTGACLTLKVHHSLNKKQVA